MSAYKNDPELALATLQKLAAEIPSGVSVEDVGEVVPVLGSKPDEITNNLREVIAAELRDSLACFWEAHNINQKLKIVKKLECSDSEKRVPATMQEIVNGLHGEQLKRLKKDLETRVRKIKEENNKLESSVKEKSDLLERQLNQINSTKFTL
ncbi:uncharacterized protein LOC103313548 [Tribolium castaneum]|uniref:Uncharacterized protein n=1 Tax=Tribolium castaneum TaxID=7070 RepID=D6WRZ3_TRICA|nr:PREDICTED: uncharacterized protein LOC103313548 [Tribolium castaneum]EFA06603.1 hypothetical protein TcasGA2_TC009518 [Tribolium castaneum]|eukprot:XP_008195276.1 PREDICTED: uncharacterized protein LOC103313548 [Tribolium castaneum]